MTLKMMDDMRNQFFDLLSDIGFVSKTRGVKVSYEHSFISKMPFHVIIACFILKFKHVVD
jgi:ATP-dependent RNA helicase DHX36